MAKIKALLNELTELFLPAASVGGLQITDTSIRYLELKKNGSQVDVYKSASLGLPPGIIQNGRVKDKENFIAALKNVHSQIEKNARKHVNVIVTIPTGDVYAEAFSLPPLHGANLDDAVELNLKMVSPNPIDQSYYGWQIASGGAKEAGPIEILGVFALKEVIDELTYCLENSGFGIAAIEFSSLSMARMLAFYNIVKKDKPYLLVKLTEEGLIFMILRNGSLYFDYFHSWGKFSSANNNSGVTVDAITKIIKSESTRVLNFYNSRWGGQIKNIILIAPALIEEISQFLRVNYPEFEISVFSSSKENLHGVRGAALRGLTLRGTDTEINLMNPKGLSAFWQDEIINFIGLWRNVVATVLVFLVLLYAGSDMFLKSRAAAAAAPPPNLNAADSAELANLKKEAADFNNSVAVLKQEFSSIHPLYPIISAVSNSANAGVHINRLSISSSGSGALDGIAQDSDSVFAFQKTLSSLKQISNVVLPFSNIITQPDGRVTFGLTFQIVQQSR